MKRTMTRLPEQVLRDEAEMRAFYLSCGISAQTTELAIRIRRYQPVPDVRNASEEKRVGAGSERTGDRSSSSQK
jgi:hypothetical protein